MHHHVFDPDTVAEVCGAVGLEVLTLTVWRPFHIVCLCRVSGDHDAELLDGIPGAYERAQLGVRQVSAGETIPLNEP
jgi:hypothetical protein